MAKNFKVFCCCLLRTVGINFGDTRNNTFYEKLDLITKKISEWNTDSFGSVKKNIRLKVNNRRISQIGTKASEGKMNEILGRRFIGISGQGYNGC